VEQATGPDKELDAQIRCAVFAGPSAYVKQSPINGEWCIYESGANGRERSWEGRDITREQRLGPFTGSLDAAMSLVPEGWRVAGIGETVIEGTDPWNVRLLERRFDGRAKLAQGDAATAALALTAAALRTRAGEI